MDAVTLVGILILKILAHEVYGRGMLWEPPQRSSMWRFSPWKENKLMPRNIDDSGLNCGGFWRLHGMNKGQCGLCGDPFDGKHQNEAGGKYAKGIISRTYRSDNKYIKVSVDVISNVGGYFEFRLCANNNPKRAITQQCLDKYVLTIEGHGKRYRPDEARSHRLRLKIPNGVTCSQCVLQWKWKGSNNWGICEDGYGGIGCGDQEEYYNCADIAILSPFVTGNTTATTDAPFITTVFFNDRTKPRVSVPTDVPPFSMQTGHTLFNIIQTTTSNVLASTGAAVVTNREIKPTNMATTLWSISQGNHQGWGGKLSNSNIIHTTSSARDRVTRNLNRMSAESDISPKITSSPLPSSLDAVSSRNSEFKSQSNAHIERPFSNSLQKNTEIRSGKRSVLMNTLNNSSVINNPNSINYKPEISTLPTYSLDNTTIGTPSNTSGAVYQGDNEKKNNSTKTGAQSLTTNGTSDVEIPGIETVTGNISHGKIEHEPRDIETGNINVTQNKSKVLKIESLKNSSIGNIETEPLDIEFGSSNFTKITLNVTTNNPSYNLTNGHVEIESPDLKIRTFNKMNTKDKTSRSLKQLTKGQVEIEPADIEIGITNLTQKTSNVGKGYQSNVERESPEIEIQTAKSSLSSGLSTKPSLNGNNTKLNVDPPDASGAGSTNITTRQSIQNKIPEKTFNTSQHKNGMEVELMESEFENRNLTQRSLNFDLTHPSVVKGNLFQPNAEIDTELESENGNTLRKQTVHKHNIYPRQFNSNGTEAEKRNKKKTNGANQSRSNAVVNRKNVNKTLNKLINYTKDNVLIEDISNITVTTKQQINVNESKLSHVLIHETQMNISKQTNATDGGSTRVSITNIIDKVKSGKDNAGEIVIENINLTNVPHVTNQLPSAERRGSSMELPKIPHIGGRLPTAVRGESGSSSISSSSSSSSTSSQNISLEKDVATPTQKSQPTGIDEEFFNNLDKSVAASHKVETVVKESAGKISQIKNNNIGIFIEPNETKSNTDPFNVFNSTDENTQNIGENATQFSVNDKNGFIKSNVSYLPWVVSKTDATQSVNTADNKTLSSFKVTKQLHQYDSNPLAQIVIAPSSGSENKVPEVFGDTTEIANSKIFSTKSIVNDTLKIASPSKQGQHQTGTEIKHSLGSKKVFIPQYVVTDETTINQNKDIKEQIVSEINATTTNEEMTKASSTLDRSNGKRSKFGFPVITTERSINDVAVQEPLDLIQSISHTQINPVTGEENYTNSEIIDNISKNTEQISGSPVQNIRTLPSNLNNYIPSLKHENTESANKATFVMEKISDHNVMSQEHIISTKHSKSVSPQEKRNSQKSMSSPVVPDANVAPHEKRPSQKPVFSPVIQPTISKGPNIQTIKSKVKLETLKRPQTLGTHNLKVIKIPPTPTLDVMQKPAVVQTEVSPEKSHQLQDFTVTSEVTVGSTQPPVSKRQDLTKPVGSLKTIFVTSAVKAFKIWRDTANKNSSKTGEVFSVNNENKSSKFPITDSVNRKIKPVKGLDQKEINSNEHKMKRPDGSQLDGVSDSVPNSIPLQAEVKMSAIQSPNTIDRLKGTENKVVGNLSKWNGVELGNRQKLKEITNIAKSGSSSTNKRENEMVIRGSSKNNIENGNITVNGLHTNTLKNKIAVFLPANNNKRKHKIDMHGLSHTRTDKDKMIIGRPSDKNKEIIRDAVGGPLKTTRKHKIAIQGQFDKNTGNERMDKGVSLNNNVEKEKMETRGLSKTNVGKDAVILHGPSDINAGKDRMAVHGQMNTKKGNDKITPRVPSNINVGKGRISINVPFNTHKRPDNTAVSGISNINTEKDSKQTQYPVNARNDRVEIQGSTNVNTGKPRMEVRGSMNTIVIKARNKQHGSTNAKVEKDRTTVPGRSEPNTGKNALRSPSRNREGKDLREIDIPLNNIEKNNTQFQVLSNANIENNNVESTGLPNTDTEKGKNVISGSSKSVSGPIKAVSGQPKTIIGKDITNFAQGNYLAESEDFLGKGLSAGNNIKTEITDSIARSLNKKESHHPLN